MLQTGGAAVSASIALQGGQAGGELAVQVRDRATGLYDLQFSLIQV